MEVSSPSLSTADKPAVDPAAEQAAALAAARAAPDFAERLDRFKSLSSTVLDTSGKIADEDRVNAFQAINRMKVTGQLRGMVEIRSTLDEIDFKSDIGQRAQQLQAVHMASVMAAGEAGGAASAIRAAMSNIDGLSKADQNVLFGSLKGPDRTGASEYTSVNAWRDNLNAQLKLMTYLRPNGEFEPKAGDSKFEQALGLSKVKNNTTAEWTKMVLQLFDTGPQDVIDLSDNARKLAGEPVNNSARTNSYQAGSVASKLA